MQQRLPQQLCRARIHESPILSVNLFERSLNQTSRTVIDPSDVSASKLLPETCKPGFYSPTVGASKSGTEHFLLANSPHRFSSANPETVGTFPSKSAKSAQAIEAAAASIVEKLQTPSRTRQGDFRRVQSENLGQVSAPPAESGPSRILPLLDGPILFLGVGCFAAVDCSLNGLTSDIGRGKRNHDYSGVDEVTARKLDDAIW